MTIPGTADAVSCAVLDDENQRTVDTDVPATIKLQVGGFGGMASVSCQKSGTQGTMLLELYVDGNKEVSGKRSAQYGLVDVSYP